MLDATGDGSEPEMLRSRRPWDVALPLSGSKPAKGRVVGGPESIIAINGPHEFLLGGLEVLASVLQ